MSAPARSGAARHRRRRAAEDRGAACDDDAVLTVRCDQDQRSPGGGIRDYPHARSAHPDGREVPDGLGAEQIRADGGDHLHVRPAEARGDRLICALAAKSHVEAGAEHLAALGTTLLMNSRSVLALPTTTIRGFLANAMSPLVSERSDVLHGIPLDQRDVESRGPAGDAGTGHALLQQLHGPGADGHERLRYRCQTRTDDLGPADIVEPHDRDVVRNVDVVLRQEMNGVDGDQIITRDDERGPLPAQQMVPWLRGSGSHRIQLASQAIMQRKCAHKAVAPLLRALQIARPRQQSDARVPLLQRVSGEVIRHDVVRVRRQTAAGRSINTTGFGECATGPVRTGPTGHQMTPSTPCCESRVKPSASPSAQP